MRLPNLASCFFLSASLALPALAAELDFENIAPGTIVDELSKGSGISGNLSGTVGVSGFTPHLGAGNNAAVIFDSSNPPSNDLDLGTPNRTCPDSGPGVGFDGELGMPFENCVPQSNILILNEAAQFVDRDNSGFIDNADSPVLLTDDADRKNSSFVFDFSTTRRRGNGTVTVNSVTIMDVEREEFVGDAIILRRPGFPDSFVSIPPQGDNGIVEIDGIGLPGVSELSVLMDGSGAIASVTVNEDAPRPCWITTGGFHNAGVQAGPKICTFGGNVGPPASGAWQVIDHGTGDNFHSNDVMITQCLVIDHTGPGQPGGKKGFDINRAEFAGTGRLNGVDGFAFTGYVIDGGEPGGKQSNQTDEFGLVARNGAGEVVFDCSGELDGGNVQIHPPVGKP